MNGVPVKDLRPDDYYNAPVFLDDDYILLTPETPVTKQLVTALQEWDFRQLRSEGTPGERIEVQTAAETDGAEAKVVAAGTVVADAERLERIRSFYEDFVVWVEALFTRYVTRNEVGLKEITDRSKSLVETVAENRKLMLRVIGTVPPHSNYLVAHAARSTVLAVVLGQALKLPAHRLIELCMASVVHEIGMVRLPPQLYMADRKLTDQERASISAHPLLGYKILKEKQFPLAICLAALEHHERMNGAGYPRRVTGEKISLYARIIAVACSYDALTAARPFKEARGGSASILELLRNEGKQYDETVIKALVYSLSIFPVGSYVLLTNGKSAQVVDVNTENPRYPVVQVLGVRTPDGKEVIVQTSETGVRVLRALTKAEAAERIPS